MPELWANGHPKDVGLKLKFQKEISQWGLTFQFWIQTKMWNKKYTYKTKLAKLKYMKQLEMLRNISKDKQGKRDSILKTDYLCLIDAGLRPSAQISIFHKF